MNPKRILTLFLLLSSFAFLFPFSKSLAVQEEFVIKSLPEKVLFSITNMAPGRSETRDFVILNNSKEDFNYKTSITLKSGSELLYKELLVEIADKDKVLFKGKLSDLTKLESRTLAKSTSEKLYIKVIEPTTLGNDFQGLGCELEFRFSAESNIAGESPVNGNPPPNDLSSELPNTATNMFNYLVLGTVLISIGLFLKIYIYRRKNVG